MKITVLLADAETERFEKLLKRVGASDPGDIVTQALQAYEFILREEGDKRTQFFMQRAHEAAPSPFKFISGSEVGS